MSNESVFKFGEIVRIKKDLENTNLKTDDCGIIWAVYPSFIKGNSGVLEFDYEGTFCDREGNESDLMFDEADVEKVLKIEDEPFSESMKDLWLYLNEKNQRSNL